MVIKASTHHVKNIFKVHAAKTTDKILTLLTYFNAKLCGNLNSSTH